MNHRRKEGDTMARDERGLTLTTESEAAARAFDDTLRHALEYRLDVPDLMARMFEDDPDFVMGHCLKGLLLLGAQSSRLLPAAQAALQAAEAGTARVTDRERRNVAALRAMVEGDRPRACAIWDDLLVRYPTDLMALRQLTFAYFWSGQSYAVRDAGARVLHAWDESQPGYGYVLGMYAFGLEESGEYGKGEELGKRAVEVNRDDLWAVHAVCHVLEMQGRLEDGIAWMTESSRDWFDRNPFRGHLWWHLSLFYLERGQYDDVLQLYDDCIRDKTSDFYTEIQNASSLLLRLEFLGVDVGDRWEELADCCESRIGDLGLGFTATHDMMALAMAGRADAADRLMQTLHDHAVTCHDVLTANMERVTLPLCEAVRAFARKDYGRAIMLINACRHDIQSNGASHAQRDVFVQTLIESALRGGDTALALSLLSARLEGKPHSVGTWHKYAGLLRDLGKTTEADDAERQAARYTAAA
jgi:tetratricopeptide (TPR) repeat protein